MFPFEDPKRQELPKPEHGSPGCGADAFPNSDEDIPTSLDFFPGLQKEFGPAKEDIGRPTHQGRPRLFSVGDLRIVRSVADRAEASRGFLSRARGRCVTKHQAKTESKHHRHSHHWSSCLEDVQIVLRGSQCIVANPIERG